MVLRSMNKNQTEKNRMSIKATVKVGACNVSLEADNPVDLIKRVSQFTQLPKKCGHCNSDTLSLMHRTAGNSDEYDYYFLKCDDCGAQGDLGQKKAPKGDIFFRYQPKDKTNVKDGFYKYWEQAESKKSSGGSTQSSQSSASARYADDDDGDDIPF